MQRGHRPEPYELSPQNPPSNPTLALVHARLYWIQFPLSGQRCYISRRYLISRTVPGRRRPGPPLHFNEPVLAFVRPGHFWVRLLSQALKLDGGRKATEPGCWI